MQILARNAGASHVKQLIESRVNTTRKLYAWLQQSQIFPEVIVSGSAIGYYGIDDQEKWAEMCTEQSPPQPILCPSFAKSGSEQL